MPAMARSTSWIARAGPRSGGTPATASKPVLATAAWASRTSLVVPPAAASRRSANAAACRTAPSLRCSAQLGLAAEPRTQLAEADHPALLRVPQLEPGAGEAAADGQASDVLQLGHRLH